MEKEESDAKAEEAYRKGIEKAKNVVRNVKRLRKTIFMSWSLML